MVSIIVPCKEKRPNQFSLFSIYSQSYKDKEIIVIEDKLTPIALNEGIKKAKGDIIIRMDAHAWYPPYYVEKCVKFLNETGADNVGGICIAVGRFAKAYNMGGKFRQQIKQKATKVAKVDTVWGGCWRREIFDKYGLFDERLKRCQDIEHNMRLPNILLNPNIRAYYYPPNTLWGVIIHSFIDGLWTVYILRYGIILKWRHYLPFVGLLVIVSVLLLVLYASY